jgi:hypothetical protein
MMMVEIFQQELDLKQQLELELEQLLVVLS